MEGFEVVDSSLFIPPAQIGLGEVCERLDGPGHIHALLTHQPDQRRALAAARRTIIRGERSQSAGPSDVVEVE